MKKKSLAAAVSLLVATGFAVAQSPSSEVRTSTDQNRAEQILERADHSSGGQGMSGDSSARSESEATTLGAHGKEVPVPSSDVRMSTDESRADDIMQRARQLSDNQQSGGSRSTSGDSMSSGASASDHSSGGTDSMSSGASGSDHSSSGAGSMSSGSGASDHSSSGSSMSSGRSAPDEVDATTGSSAAGADSAPSGVSAPPPTGESSAYGRTGPAGEDAGSSVTRPSDPSSGFGRTTAPEDGMNTDKRY